MDNKSEARSRMGSTSPDHQVQEPNNLGYMYFSCFIFPPQKNSDYITSDPSVHASIQLHTGVNSPDGFKKK